MRGVPADLLVYAVQVQPEVADARRNQAAGEIAAELDPACFLVAIMGALAAPATTPRMIEGLCGPRGTTAEFVSAYAGQLRRILGHLGGG